MHPEIAPQEPAPERRLHGQYSGSREGGREDPGDILAWSHSPTGLSDQMRSRGRFDGPVFGIQ